MTDRIVIGADGRKYITTEPAPVQQEPVAWAVYDIKHGGSATLHWPNQHSEYGDADQFKAVPLFAAPVQQDVNKALVEALEHAEPWLDGLTAQDVVRAALALVEGK